VQSGLGSPPDTYSVQGQKVRAAFWDAQARAQYRLCIELLLRIHIPNTIVQNSSTAFWDFAPGQVWLPVVLAVKQPVHNGHCLSNHAVASTLAFSLHPVCSEILYIVASIKRSNAVDTAASAPHSTHQPAQDTEWSQGFKPNLCAVAHIHHAQLFLMNWYFSKAATGLAERARDCVESGNLSFKLF